MWLVTAAFGSSGLFYMEKWVHRVGAIPTYRVYRLHDIGPVISFITQASILREENPLIQDHVYTFLQIVQHHPVVLLHPSL